MALQLAQRIIFLILICCVTTLHAQTVYYPSQSSDQLKLTTADVAALFTKAIPGSSFTGKEYTSIPSTGIIFIYDSSMINNQSCKIECTGNQIKFSAAQDIGLCFGIYTYLDELGFRFYLPGSIWEKIPKLSTPYKPENKTVSQKFKYNYWFISGGCNRWAMDMMDPYGGNFGLNGHNWSQYQLRNNMAGAYRFGGHRGDIFNDEYLSILKANPCYVACINGQRNASTQSVPDINNTNAMELWASTIQQRYTYYKNTIIGNPGLYKNFYHNLNYGNEYIGIEVPDGSAWGNSSDNLGCVTGNFNGKPYPKVSDQQFLLANFTASKIKSAIPDRHFQCYAYSGHANVPSADISIDKNIDVQVVATAFQSETSPVGLLNRWYQRHQNISEYDYLNIPQWTGETPIFSLGNYANTLARIKEKNGQGIVMEASPAKFASLPFLFAGNRYLQYDIKIENSIDEFTANMFPQNVAVHIKQLLYYWGNYNNIINGGDFVPDNKYKLPLFLQELNKAVEAAKNESAEVTARLQEFKAYLHYIVLYYNFINDATTYPNKSEKAANLCLYLATINKLQLVNSYFLILDIVNKFAVTSDFYKQYNVSDGAAYVKGNLPLISNEEINKNFSDDIVKYGTSVTDYKLENAADIISKMSASNLKPLDKIKVGVGYTNGANYPGRYEFYFYAPAAGSININCTPGFEMPGEGFINLTVEAADKPLLVIKDETITRENNPGNSKIDVPAAGLYKLSVVSKFKTNANLVITTNGNTFFKLGPFFGKRAESYRIDTLKSLPNYFYVPNISQLYFSINNACYTNRCLSPVEVENTFGIKDNNGKAPVIEVSPFDSLLYKISIPAESANTFWQVTKFREYNFCLANVSNIEIFAESIGCDAANFTATIINKDGNCFTRITAISSGTLYREWIINDGAKQFRYTMLKTVDLPVLLSPNAIISLSVSGYCSASKRTGDIKNYVQNSQACTSSASQVPLSDLIVYPNPSFSVFNFKKNSAPLMLNKINVYDPQGKKVADAANASSINLSNLPAGVYIFSAQKDNDMVKGKLIKN